MKKERASLTSEGLKRQQEKRAVRSPMPEIDLRALIATTAQRLQDHTDDKYLGLSHDIQEERRALERAMELHLEYFHARRWHRAWQALRERWRWWGDWWLGIADEEEEYDE